MNIIIYAQNGQSALAEAISNIDDFDVRVFSDDNILGYKELNPAVVILDTTLDKIKQVTEVTKFETSLLCVVDEIPTGMTIRAEAYDFIKRPINTEELAVRTKAMSKIIRYRNIAKKISMTDELTGLYNRKYLHHRLESEISRARRYGGSVSCILFDIDYFKTVNDMYGYDWGDVLLKKIAQMLEGLIRKEDVLTRYGDEEFMLLLPNTDENNAFIFAERFRKDIEKMEFIPANEEEAHPVTISGGISAYPYLDNMEEDANSIIRYAEHALYSAKQKGKNQIVQFSRMNLDF